MTTCQARTMGGCECSLDIHGHGDWHRSTHGTVWSDRLVPGFLSEAEHALLSLVETAQLDSVPLHQVTLWLCELCLAGAGGECHVPGCALWMNRAPDMPVLTGGEDFRAGRGEGVGLRHQ
jgi:hypothetical protein